MAPPPPSSSGGPPRGTPTAFDRRCLDVLKSIGKMLGQMHLYNSVSHPAMQAIMAETIGILTEILAQAAEGGIIYVLDGETVVANGRVAGQVSALPHSIPQVWARFKLHSITFRAGVTLEEMSALCQLVSMRPEAAKGVDAAEELRGQKVTHIGINEAIYAKVEKDQEPDVPETAVSHIPTEERAEKLFTEVKSANTIEDAIRALVAAAGLSSEDQERIFNIVITRLREDVQRRINEATREIRFEKVSAENTSARAQAVVATQSNGVVVVDEQGKVLMMNPEAEEILGKSMAELAGKPLAQNLSEEHMASLAQEIQTPGERGIRRDVDVVGAADAKRALRGSSAVVQNEAGQTVGLISSLTDKAKFREIEKVEREFVAHVTHELRAPLTSIKAALEILQDMFGGRLKEDEQRMMNNALKNSERLDELIRGILDFSKIESGQMTVYPKPVDSEKLAKDAAETMVPWAQKKGIKLTVSAQPDLSQVNADVPRTTQVFVNLLSNALKFTPKGGAITVRAAPAPESFRDSKSNLFSVEDTGPGIPKEEQGRIFQKFVQIASGEHHVGGTGLGLAIAKALIHLQGGRMWVDSALGKGAKFYFTLPHYIPTKEELLRAKRPLPWWKRLLGFKA